jgi:5'-nucleotidase
MASQTSRTERKPVLLLTNDDGFFAEGLNALRSALKGLGTIYVVAPDREKSACSLSLTLHRPLRVQKLGPRAYAVDGTPADCVYLAVQKLLRRKPDLLVSGINRGPNLGRQDISYSGTVAGAIQGTYLGIRSLAFSLLAGREGRYDFPAAGAVARLLAEKWLAGGPGPGPTLNVNIPPPPHTGARLTALGEKRYSPEIVEKKDPRRNSYFWIGTGNPRRLGGPGSDIRAVEDGWISLTPLHTDLTDYGKLASGPLKKLVSVLSAGAGHTRRRSGRQKSG